MRKFLIFCLLASAATPVLARPDKDDDSRPARPARSESAPARADRSESRPARVERTQVSDRPQWTGGERPARPAFERSDRPERPRVEPPGGGEGRRWTGSSDGGHDRRASPVPAATRDQPDSVRDWRPREARRVDRRPNPEPTQTDGRVPDGRPTDRDRADRGVQGWTDRHFGDRRRGGAPEVSTVPRRWTQPPARAHRDGGSVLNRWHREWRDDHRYDWRHHRNRHRSIFHLGFYYDPFGWGYQRYNVGWRLWPNYYSRSHWLNDPWMYRLPPAYPGTQWIRYYDDALLVDIWTGEVVDVIYDFFW